MSGCCDKCYEIYDPDKLEKELKEKIDKNFMEKVDQL